MKSKRKAISPIIATLILIVITVIAGIFLYSFVSGYLGALSSTTSTPVNVQIMPINITSNNQNHNYPTISATLYVTITNVGTSPIALYETGSLYFSNGTLAGSATITSTTPSSASSSATNTVSVAPGQTITATISLSTTSPYTISAGYSYYIKLTTSTGYVVSSSSFIP